MTCDVVVYGATGLVGRRVCAELDQNGVSFAIAGRELSRVRDWPSADRRGDDLSRAFAGAQVVVSTPPAAIAEPILVAALAALRTT